jgi:hypothetical protein
MDSRRPEQEPCSKSRSRCAPLTIGMRPNPASWKLTWSLIVAPMPTDPTSTRFSLTDIPTGWTECLPLLNRSQEAVVAALKGAQQLLPFPLLGIDTDNRAEFINVERLSFCEQEQLTFTRGRPRRSNDQCYVEQKNGQIVRQVVGYDRFEGLLTSATTHRTLSGAAGLCELFSTLHETPNERTRGKSKCGASMIRPKRRCNDSLHLRSCRPKSSKNCFGSPKRLPPLRLLTQLEHLQKALWRHAVTPASEPAASPAPLQFSVQQCTEEKVPIDGLPHTPPSLLKRARKKKYHKTGRPHDWRTRKDPFEGEWEQITSWLLAHPELTGVEIFHRLEQISPGRYRPTQLRTLQRSLSRLRTRLLVTFEDQWGAEVVNGQPPAPELRAEVVIGV